jgi:Ricin-type beta-trefoil lectin domain-like
LVATNSSSVEVEISIDLSSFILTGELSQSGFVTSHHCNIEPIQVDNLEILSKASYIIKPESIVTYVIKGLLIPAAQIIPQVPWHQLCRGVYKIQNVFSGKCLEDETTLVQSTYTGSVSQHWIFAETPKGEFTIMNASTTRVLDVKEGLDESGALVISYPRHGSYNQSWIIESLPDKNVYEIKTLTGKCMDVGAWDVGDGSQVIIWGKLSLMIDSNGGENQHWNLVRLD